MCEIMMLDDARNGGHLKDAMTSVFVEKATEGNTAALVRMMATHPAFFQQVAEAIDVPVEPQNFAAIAASLKDAGVPPRAYILRG